MKQILISYLCKISSSMRQGMYSLLFFIPFSLFGQSDSVLFPIQANAKWGYINQSGKIVIPIVFDSCGDFNQDKIAIIKNQNQDLYINNRGFIFNSDIKPPHPDMKFIKYSEGLAKIKHKGKIGYIDYNGLPRVVPKYDEGGDFSNGLAWVREKSYNDNGKVGYIDKTGNYVIQPIYEDGTSFNEGKASVVLKDRTIEKAGVIDKKGRNIIVPNSLYRDIRPFYRGLAAFQKEIYRDVFQVGYLDATGNEAIYNNYEDGGNFVHEFTWVRQKTGEYYIINKQGKLQYNESFSYITDFKNGYAKVIDNKKTLLLDTNAEFVTPTGFLAISDFSENKIAISYDDMKWGYISRDGEAIIKNIFTFAGKFLNGLARVSVDGFRYGYINAKGKIVIPYKYTTASDFINGYASVQVEGEDKFRYITPNGTESSTTWDDIEILPKGILRLWSGHPSNGRFGFYNLDTTQIEKINYAYDNVKKFENGFAPAMLNEKWGFIDQNEQWVIEPKYTDVTTFNKLGVAFVKVDGLWELINTKGEVLTTNTFNSVMPFTEGLAAVETNNIWGYIDSKGEYSIPPKYDDVKPFIGEQAIVYYKFAWSIINKKGIMVKMPIKYQFIGKFFENVAAIRIKNQAGYINPSGNIQIPATFELAQDFSEGMAAVFKNEMWGFINKSGTMIVRNIFPIVKNFKNGLAPIVSTESELWGYIDKTGDPVIPFKWKEASEFENGYAVVKSSEDLLGVINSRGELVVKPQYADVNIMPNGYIILKKTSGKKGIVKGNENVIILPFEYDEIKEISENKVGVQYLKDWKRGKVNYFDTMKGNFIYEQTKYETQLRAERKRK